MTGKLRVTQTKSTISHIARNRATIRALGLKRIGHTVEVPDNPATRGMVRQVRFLVDVEEVPDTGGVQASQGRDGDEDGSERTRVRKRTRGGANGGPGRINADGEEKA
jgi:large subunit ribosomal protein L30